jgi:hypothetical protein
MAKTKKISINTPVVKAEVVKAVKTVKVLVDTIESDYVNGVTNFRFLANKHNTTFEEVYKIINNK